MIAPEKKKAVVMIPTYNEKENIQELIPEILSLELDFDLSILIVDDNSPDGTGNLAKTLSGKDNRIHVLIRKKRRGRGAAGIEGFKAVLEFNPDYVIEMDGDFSHQPLHIPSLLAACESSDLVIGSRLIKGGKDFDRNIIRSFITYLARIYLRRLFRIPIRDPSSGFRCFKSETLRKLDLDDLISVGPSIIQETLYKAYLMKMNIKETPIVFIDRRKGQTKLSFPLLLETLIMSIILKKRLSEAVPKHQE